MLKLVEILAWGHVLLACLGIISLGFIDVQSHYSHMNTAAAAFSLVLLFGIASAIVYTSRQKGAGVYLGDKTYPASLVAYVLFWVITWRLLGLDTIA